MPARPRVPMPATLRRYGLTAEEWKAILRLQGGVCAICRRMPASGRLVTDHVHVRGWKKMPPEQRKAFVRGVVCFMCNGKCVNKHMTLTKAMNVLAYFEAYEQRKKR